MSSYQQQVSTNIGADFILLKLADNREFSKGTHKCRSSLDPYHIPTNKLKIMESHRWSGDQASFQDGCVKLYMQCLKLSKPL